MNAVLLQPSFRRSADALGVARAFLTSFGAGQLTAAAASCSEQLVWFGRVMPREALDGESVRRFWQAQRPSFGEVRELPDLVGALSPAVITDLCGITVDQSDSLLLADARCGGAEVTLGLVVSHQRGGPRLSGVFDPSALAEHVRRCAG